MDNKSLIIIIIIVILVLIGLGIGIYFIVKNSADPKKYNISNYTEKSIWRINTMLKPGEERVSPNGLVKIYCKLVDNPNKGKTSQWFGLYLKNPNKIGKFGDIDVGDTFIFNQPMGSNIGITLTSSGIEPGGGFNIQTVTKNNTTYNVTFDGDITKASTSVYPTYFDVNGVPQGKLKMDDKTSLSSFTLKTNDIDYILVRDDAILIFNKNNKLLGVF